MNLESRSKDLEVERKKKEFRIMKREVGRKIRNFTDLKTWTEGHELVLIVYKISSDFPKGEMFGLTSQMRRCVVSITSNIAEGFGRKSYKEKIQFYYVSAASVSELQNQLIIARDLSYVSKKEFKMIFEQSIVVHKLINGLIRSSRNKIA